MMEDTNKTLHSSVKDLVEIIGKSMLGIVAFCYVTGLLITSMYSMKYKISHLELLRFSYVAAGALAITPILIFVITYLLILCVLAGIYPPIENRLLFRALNLNFANEIGKRTVINRILFVLCSFLALFLLYTVTIALHGTSQRFIPRLIYDENAQMIFTYAFIVSVVLVWSLRNLALGSFQGLRTVFPIVFTVLFFLYYISAFALFYYDTIPSRFGGGSPTSVQFIIEVNPETKMLLETAGVDFQETIDQTADQTTDNKDDKDKSKSYRTKDILLVFSTDKEYVVIVRSRDNDRAIITLTKDTVKAIVHKQSNMEVWSLKGRF